ncbi:hypothetical protein O3P69_000380 [Scylla paramamosain]|uniref:PHD-type domain-containing protein n=1 Tax=Scylla paramamosain TaxID=85552 RepID=A0AAW0UST2_SCYPA
MASFPCIYCSTEVRPRQQALQCDGCDQWQHRTCDTGITQEDYRHMVRGEIGDQQWYCVQCLPPEITDSLLDVPVAESTVLETESMEVTPIPDISTRPAIPNQCEDVLADEIIEYVPGENILNQHSITYNHVHLRDQF